MTNTLARARPVWLALAAFACAPGVAPRTAETSPHPAAAATPSETRGAAWRLSYRLSGGLAGFDVSFRVGGDGEAAYERRRPNAESARGRLAVNEVAALARLVHESGFLDLAPRYDPKGAMSDAFTYVVRWEEGDRVHEVTGMDGVALPPAFLDVREAVAALERKLLVASHSPSPAASASAERPSPGGSP